jgi:Fe-S-cluster containining protein
MAHRLPILDAEIAARCAQTAQAHPFWPCRSGCDHCCRSLAEIPRMTEPEWHRLSEAFVSLPLHERTAVEQRLEPLRHSTKRPFVCPFLDDERGTCRVYEARPLACRTYGFYVEGRDGKHCQRVSDALAEHDPSDVVWGNESALFTRAEKELGPARSLFEWLDAERSP